MRVFLHRDFLKAYKKLSPHDQENWKARKRIFLENPFHPLLSNHALHGEYEGYRSINITGDIRAIYEPHDTNVALFIIIGSHSELYS